MRLYLYKLWKTISKPIAHLTCNCSQAHAKVWHTYDTQWRAKQKGKQDESEALTLFALCISTILFDCYQLLFTSAGLIGISLSGDWGEPVDISSQKDIEAAERYVQFYVGWFATPIFHGDYPQVMKDFVGKIKCKQLFYTLVIRGKSLTTIGDCVCRKEECPAGPRHISPAHIFPPGEELHQGDLRLPWHRSFYHPLHYSEEQPIRPQQQQLLHWPWPSWAGWPTVAWPWVRVALLCALGFQTSAQLCQGDSSLIVHRKWFVLYLKCSHTDWIT